MSETPEKEKNQGGKKPYFKKRYNNRNKKRHDRPYVNKDKETPSLTLPDISSGNEEELVTQTVNNDGVGYEPYSDEAQGTAPVGYASSFGGNAEEKLPELVPEAEVPKVEIIGVRFKEAGKIYYFSPGDFRLEKDTPVIVETARGVEYSFVAVPNSMVSESSVVQPLKPIIRVATPDDTRRYENNKRLESEAIGICEEKIKEHGLEMKLVDVEYTFDNNKLIFYFTADGRVDFRELVKDLATVFRTRIELRQIGIRDEAKLLGGLGICGRVFCCNSFLGDFAQVSIKMAKDQNLSLNSAKISGTCGRLICCLKYENDVYESEIKKTPPVDSIVRCKDGDEGVVIDTSPLAGLVKVRLNNKSDTVIKMIPREDVEVIGKMKKGDAHYNDGRITEAPKTASEQPKE